MASEANPEEQAVEAGAVAASSARPLAWRDIRGTIPRHADELVSTEAEAAALKALRVATGETDGGMERHTMREYLIAERIADMRGIRSRTVGVAGCRASASPRSSATPRRRRRSG